LISERKEASKHFDNIKTATRILSCPGYFFKSNLLMSAILSSGAVHEKIWN